MPTGRIAPPLPSLSPSPPLHRVLPTDQAQTASSASGGPTRLPPWLAPPSARPQVAVAPPVGGQAAVTTAKAAVPVAKAALPVLQAIVPAAHAATAHVPAPQAVHAKAAVRGSKAEAYARLKAAPPAMSPERIWWRGQRWSSRWGQGSFQGWWSSQCQWWSSQDWQ